MATRFGGASPTYAYTIKVRYIVGLLILIIVILAFTLLLILNEQPAQEAGLESVEPAFQQQAVASSPRVEVLGASVRIEEGAMLERQMFKSLSVNADEIPEGAFLWREVDQVGAGNKFAKTLIPANQTVTRDNVTENRPTTALKIPPGYRAVTILVDARTGVEGWAKPNSRVDVLCTYQDKKDLRTKVLTVVRFVKILSVGGSPTAEQKANVSAQSTTITLLVTERDARKIELARNIGSLTLSLVGDVEPEKVGPDQGPMDMNDMFEQPEEAPAEQPAEGYIIMTDPKTQRPVKMFLRNGKWQKDPNS